MFRRALDLGFVTGPPIDPPKHQLLKWIGNKQRHVRPIAAHLPATFNAYFEPFLGSGAMLASLMPDRAFASDSLAPLIEIFRTVQSSPEEAKAWYSDRWALIGAMGKNDAYLHVRAGYNADPNPADLLFVSRVGYGGLIRFRLDGHISTPCGSHEPIHPDAFARRVDGWQERIRCAAFECMDFRESMDRTHRGDLVYCDPPYIDTQRIVYGAQAFSLESLWDAVDASKSRGAHVAVSLDGSKRSGSHEVGIDVPDGLFETDTRIDCGTSMLRRLQMQGQSMGEERVADRLLIT